MTRILLVINGAEYSLTAVKKAIWLSKTEDSEIDLLYVNPPCNQMYPDVPGLCFWMPDFEYQLVTDRLKNRVLDEIIIPIFNESGLEPRIIITSRDQDEKIQEMSSEHGYNKIFIASPSKYCQHEEKGWFWLKNKTPKVPSGIVCLI